jgi:putative oxidoreductase
MREPKNDGLLTALLVTAAPGWTILIRLIVGLIVFFPEGIQKLIFPSILGAGRFSNIGIPYPELMGPFVGVVETICGALIVLGIFTRLAAIPLIVIMIVAILSTKVPILLGHDFWIFHAPKIARYGFWSMAHEARDDFGMLLGSLYLLIVGAGPWSIDALLSQAVQRTPSVAPGRIAEPRRSLDVVAEKE